MRDGGLPEDMYYLALVESGFDPNAYSRAAAVGMWQFMTSTGRDMGCASTGGSTSAAIRSSRRSPRCGSSRDSRSSSARCISRPRRTTAVRGASRAASRATPTTSRARAGDDLFFALAEKDYLRNETREYVPQLIAAALIAKEPARYGMTLAPQPAFAYDSVRVGPSTPLAAVAHAAGRRTIPALQDLNPQFLRGVTPPKDSFFVRVPVGQRRTASRGAFAALPKSERTRCVTVESKKGESFAIDRQARRHHGATAGALQSEAQER